MDRFEPGADVRYELNGAPAEGSVLSIDDEDTLVVLNAKTGGVDRISPLGVRLVKAPAKVETSPRARRTPEAVEHVVEVVPAVVEEPLETPAPSEWAHNADEDEDAPTAVAHGQEEEAVQVSPPAEPPESPASNAPSESTEQSAPVDADASADDKV